MQETPKKVLLESLKGYGVFSRIHESGKHYRTNLCSINYIVTDKSAEDIQIRYGLVVPKRICKKAVTRNRIKRLLRESVKQLALEDIFQISTDFVILWRNIPVHPGMIKLKDVKPVVEKLISSMNKSIDKE